MRGLLLMSITGAVLYGLLVLTNHFLTQEKPEFTLSPNDHAAGADRTLRSWGTSLPALVVEPQQRLAEQSPVGSDQAAVPDAEAIETKWGDANSSLALNATKLPIETALTKPSAPKPMRLSSKKRNRSAKFASQGADKSVTSRELRRDRRADRGRRFGLFGRRFASRGATW
jgi:hypothetical protein